MKKLLAGILLLSIQYTITSCNNGGESSTSSTATDTTTKMSTTEDTTTMGSQTNNTGGVSEAQNDFVNTAATAGMMEIELGKAAQANGASAGVKDFGSMMVTDHTAAANELKSIASKNNIAVPSAMTSEQDMHVKDMSAKKGAEFDKAYIGMMVEGHEKVLAAFKKAATEETNADLKSFAIKTAPVIQKHLDKAKNLKSKM